MPEYKFIKTQSNAKDITGQIFGRLVAIGPTSRTTRKIKWLCICECGSETIVDTYTLTSSTVKSCGCYQKQCAREANMTHGLSGTPEYCLWVSMLQRTTNPKNTGYKDYGGRGIKVCKRWLKFENFFADMGNRSSANHSIDRIDNNGNYEPLNCRWATEAEQHRNTRRNRFITYKGKTMCIADWSEKIKINYQTLINRFNRGWSVERALTEPVNYYLK